MSFIQNGSFRARSHRVRPHRQLDRVGRGTTLGTSDDRSDLRRGLTVTTLSPPILINECPCTVRVSPQVLRRLTWGKGNATSCGAPTDVVSHRTAYLVVEQPSSSLRPAQGIVLLSHLVSESHEARRVSRAPKSGIRSRGCHPRCQSARVVTAPEFAV